MSNFRGTYPVLLVLHERKTKYTLIRKLLSRNTETINRTIFKTIRGMVYFNSLTIDNDISFRKHIELSELLGAPIYFCHPYHFWEKGSIENMNKLIRRYIPKRTDISQLSDEFIKTIEDKFNQRPRKCLNFKTPYEIMIENSQLKQFDIFDILKTKNHLIKDEMVKD